MADLALLENLANAAFCRECIFRDGWDFFFCRRYRLVHQISFPKTNLKNLCEDLRPSLERRTHAVSVNIKVQSTLWFLATGSFQLELVDRHLTSPDVPMFYVLDAK
jgi:hypothetical protein